ncbi:MAG: type II 3-dehydroquinate dehydratase [Cyclobacteriaceae bacterium]|jgi:3-dehydroquinate dehydratase-2
MQIAIVNGPNLNLLGKREVEIYGDQTFEQYFKQLRVDFSEIELIYFQSNHEGAIIDFIQEKGFEVDGIILNAGGLSHTSVSLADAISAVPAKVLEVHISNIFARQKFRHHSFLSPVSAGIISGFGLDGYRMALSHFLK